MKPIDYLKAAGAGAAVLFLNLLLSIPVILVFRFVVFAGREAAWYDDLPQRVAPWSSWICGPLIFFGLMALLAARQPGRNGLIFAAAAWSAYLVLDLLGSGNPLAMLTPVVALTMTVKLAAALAGAWTGARIANRRTAR